MGLIRDVLGSAMSNQQMNNGLSGSQIPFFGGRQSTQNQGRNTRMRYFDDTEYQGRYSRKEKSSYNSVPLCEAKYAPDTDEDEPPAYTARDISYNRNTSAAAGYDDMNGYQQWNIPTSRNITGSTLRRRIDYEPENYNYQTRHASRSYFRPIAIPQVASGDGQPFLRAFSGDISRFQISQSDFIGFIDALNVAIIPNPEQQIFQFGANIAGWFIPGAASLGLMGGQVAVGVANYLGHKSMINRVLSKANLDLFLPNGLEVCLGNAANVDSEVGIGRTYQGQQSSNFYAANSFDRIEAYGNLLAPLTTVLPDIQNGRKDPIAMIGNKLASRKQQKQEQRAYKDAQKGKTKRMDKLEGDIQWIIVRQATPDALAHWQRSMQESDAEVQDAEAQISRSRR